MRCLPVRLLFASFYPPIDVAIFAPADQARAIETPRYATMIAHVLANYEIMGMEQHFKLKCSHIPNCNFCKDKEKKA